MRLNMMLAPEDNARFEGIPHYQRGKILLAELPTLPPFPGVTAERRRDPRPKSMLYWHVSEECYDAICLRFAQTNEPISSIARRLIAQYLSHHPDS